MSRSLFALALLAVVLAGMAPEGAANQDTGKSTLLYVLTRQAKIPDAGGEGVSYEVTRAPAFEVLVVEVLAARLEDKNTHLGRYYEHPARREGKKGEIGIYAKAQLKEKTKLTNFKPIGERTIMKYFAGAIGTVNPNLADKKKTRPEMDSFYIYQAEAFDPK
jgi:hypothetical protein